MFTHLPSPLQFLIESGHRITARVLSVLLLSALTLSPHYSTAFAQENGNKEASISIREVSSRFDGDELIVEPELTLNLTDAATEAVISGIPITLNIDVEVLRKRSWIWDETIASSRHEIRLSYHPLSRQFLLFQSQIETYGIFRHLDLVLSALRQPGAIRIALEAPLKADEHYVGRIRFHLDVAKLPRPLQLPAYLTEDWRLDSDWVNWQIERPQD